MQLEPPDQQQHRRVLSTDDTIFLSTAFATAIWKGLLPARGTSGQYAGSAFGVAYVVAHEYGHNVQSELGIGRTQATSSQLELQADCFAGVFANSEYYAGSLQPGDPERAISTASLVGDFDYSSVTHHGTPAERVAAWRLGYNGGTAGTCIKSFSP